RRSSRGSLPRLHLPFAAFCANGPINRARSDSQACIFRRLFSIWHAGLLRALRSLPWQRRRPRVGRCTGPQQLKTKGQFASTTPRALCAHPTTKYGYGLSVLSKKTWTAFNRRVNLGPRLSRTPLERYSRVTFRQ